MVFLAALTLNVPAAARPIYTTTALSLLKRTVRQFENPGTVLDDCSDQTSEYMQLFYDCQPDDGTGSVAFTAWANACGEITYNNEDIIVFNEILTHRAAL